MRNCESCFCKCKDTKLKAIHNVIGMSYYGATVVFANAKILNWKQFTTLFFHRYANGPVVFANAKILNWKQFTTCGGVARLVTLLFLQMQRY